MLNLRNVALAAALLLALAVGVALADPASDAAEASAEVVARVSNVRVFEPQYDWDPVPSGLHAAESLVEGHSVFVVLEHRGNRTAVEGTVTVAGEVDCDYRAEAGTSPWLLGVPMVTGVREAWAKCRAYDQVVVTPAVYCQVQGDWACDAPSAPVLVPTGERAAFLSPDGQAGEMVEYAFTATPPGEREPRTFYAYAVPVFDPWVHEDDGATRNLWAPLPLDRLAEMDVWDFKFLRGDAVERL